ncbi:hypothetical protein AYI68_g1007 [Smittium mucronatum]|uniref:MIT domain-containing protein n=1 Tax=Smittium mucronatum TaxID=133383 RepID=A0A1R0H6V6_9FUNG|nr:hypothetical protein AYI68_g1007 [Smittium mucronatum]
MDKNGSRSFRFLLTLALRKAQLAVSLDNRGQIRESIIAYKEAVDTLDSVLLQTQDVDSIQKLDHFIDLSIRTDNFSVDSGVYRSLMNNPEDLGSDPTSGFSQLSPNIAGEAPPFSSSEINIITDNNPFKSQSTKVDLITNGSSKDGFFEPKSNNMFNFNASQGSDRFSRISFDDENSNDLSFRLRKKDSGDSNPHGLNPIDLKVNEKSIDISNVAERLESVHISDFYTEPQSPFCHNSPNDKSSINYNIHTDKLNNPNIPSASNTEIGKGKNQVATDLSNHNRDSLLLESYKYSLNLNNTDIIDFSDPVVLDSDLKNFSQNDKSSPPSSDSSRNTVGSVIIHPNADNVQFDSEYSLFGDVMSPGGSGPLQKSISNILYYNYFYDKSDLNQNQDIIQSQNYSSASRDEITKLDISTIPNHASDFDLLSDLANNENSPLNPFTIVRLFLQSMETSGAFISPTMFISQKSWLQTGVRLSFIDHKISIVEQLISVLENFDDFGLPEIVYILSESSNNHQDDDHFTETDDIMRNKELLAIERLCKEASGTLKGLEGVMNSSRKSLSKRLKYISAVRSTKTFSNGLDMFKDSSSGSKMAVVGILDTDVLEDDESFYSEYGKDYNNGPSQYLLDNEQWRAKWHRMGE